MASLHERLQAIKQRIADADQRVQHQLGLVETLAQDGHNAQPAIDLLGSLEKSVRILEERLAYIEEMIGREHSN